MFGGVFSFSFCLPMNNLSSHGNPVGIPGRVAPVPALKHSGLGIASFALSLMAWGALLAAYELTHESGPAHPSPRLVLGWHLFFGALWAHGVAFILGLISLFIPRRKKVFGILGFVFSGVPLGLILALFWFLEELLKGMGRAIDGSP